MAKLKPTLGVELGRLRLPTPVVIASGCFGLAGDVSGLVELRKVGGIVTRSVTLAPTKGSETPRMAETPSGVLSATGYQNPGAEAFARELASLARSGVPIIASVAGATVEEYLQVAVILGAAPGVVALEANLSLADADHDGRPFDTSPLQAGEVVAAVARGSRLPVFAKLSADGADVTRVARACLEAGADGLTLINSIPGMAVDAETARPRLAAVTGRLSGPAIRPIALRMIFQVARAIPDAPIFGVGGVSTATHAMELMAVGASAVQVGTATLVNPAAPVEIAVGILEHLASHGLRSPLDLRGRALGRAHSATGIRAAP